MASSIAAALRVRLASSGIPSGPDAFKHPRAMFLFVARASAGLCALVGVWGYKHELVVGSGRKPRDLVTMSSTFFVINKRESFHFRVIWKKI